MSEEDKESRDEKAVKDAVEKLSGLFDNVQIFVSRYEGGDDGGTYNYQYGRGEWFSRYGLVRAWLVRADEQTRIKARKDGEDGND